MIFRTTVQLIQVIIICLVYYLSIIVIQSFSCHLCMFDCWPVCLHWSDQRSLILKLVLWCARKLSVGRIQSGHTYLIPPQVCVRLWWGWWLGVHTCLLQLIDLLDLKPPSTSLSKPYFVDCWLLCIIFIGSAFIDTGTFPWVCYPIDSGTYPNRNTDLLPLHICGRLWQGCRFFCFPLLNESTS